MNSKSDNSVYLKPYNTSDSYFVNESGTVYTNSKYDEDECVESYKVKDLSKVCIYV